MNYSILFLEKVIDDRLNMVSHHGYKKCFYNIIIKDVRYNSNYVGIDFEYKSKSYTSFDQFIDGYQAFSYGDLNSILKKDRNNLIQNIINDK